ncbi:hypothetical protein CRG98_027801 [Punica granatum]|uniref:Reverse transcriptase/retrotransposon-derived protein RNase H-like domain-containing protein n=1 Tax=Punica granatum TaxID=22663 RepID=A0A2I0J6D9_PUNGR|nr:hypothetical protein CRG98_027801 [Punica granatum]
MDTVDEWRFEATESMAQVREAASKFYNARVKAREFCVGDWILKNKEFKCLAHYNKLTPKWESPYKMVGVPHPGVYVLTEKCGKKLPRTFNVMHLRKCQF